MRATAPTADSVAGAVAELAVRLSAADDPEPVRAGVRALVSGPLELFGSQDGWPSLLGDDGIPLELSVKDAGGTCGVRCTVDPCDYRRTVAANLSGLAAAARQCVAWQNNAGTTGDWACEPGRLIESLLADAPEALPAPIMLSLGLGSAGLARTTVYVRTSFWCSDALGARLPGPAAVLAKEASTYGAAVLTEPEVFGVDYVRGCPTRWKSYHWLPARPGRFAAIAGTHPDLAPAAALYDRFVAGVPAAPAEKVGFLQVTGGAGPVRQKVFFFAPAWGWATPEGLVDLLLWLPSVGARLDSLLAVREIMARYGIPVRLSMVAVGGGPETTVTYYFVPQHR